MPTETQIDTSNDDVAIAEQDSVELQMDEAQQEAFLAEVGPRVRKFCADCHVMPRPSSSSRDDWVMEVQQGIDLYKNTKREDLVIPDQAETVKYFQLQAPERLVLSDAARKDPPSPIKMRPMNVRMSDTRVPGISNVRWIDLGIKPSPAFVYCNISNGGIIAHWPQESDTPTERLATLLQPVHLEPCDLDGDGAMDLLAADIGEFNANDSDLGSVVWIRQDPKTHKFKPIEILTGLSRVSDVRAGDFDADGDLDLLVGVFGWRQTGQILLLTREGEDDEGLPTFVSTKIDERPGTVNLPIVDLNGDGYLDFVALISQETERVEAFVNDGNGKFETKVIYECPDPAYGSSGIELADLDGDGDLDVLFTNGDSFDRGPKPYHSVQWLENAGEYPYKHHLLCEMPGVLNAQAADFDNDGDLDIVACSLMADPIISELNQTDTSSVLLLTQEEPGVFRRSFLEKGRHHHISLESGDFNGDGKIDVAVGTFLRNGSPDQPDLVVWMNEHE
ncbi:MAG: VCBS repeat-containing protein [Pirellulaceae bacterium]